MTRRGLTQALACLLIGASLVGCGAGGRKVSPTGVAAKGALPSVAEMAPAPLEGQAGVRFGSGGQGAEAPAVARAGDGSWVMAFVGTQTGDRKVFVSSSADGQAWTKASPLPGARAYSDQAPALATDPAGRVHLAFLSNREGGDWAMYHASWQGGAMGEAQRVEGFGGGLDLAIAFRGEALVVAAELRGVGLVLAEGPAEATAFEEAELVSEQGFEPALAQGPEGQLALAYRRGDAVLAQVGKPGAWGAAKPLAAGGDGVKRREPALAWGSEGLLAAWTEQGQPVARRVAAEGLALSAGPQLPAAPAGVQAKQLALAWGPKGQVLAAWGQAEAAQSAVACAWIQP